MDIQSQIMGMSSWAQESLRCMFFHGPTLDGDIPSKEGRSELVRLGLAQRFEGYNWLNREGVDFAITVMLLGPEKEKWQRSRSSAVAKEKDNRVAIERLIDALEEAERFMAYFAGETGGHFSGPGTPQTCLQQIRAALR
jgi:hypothetical protein